MAETVLIVEDDPSILRGLQMNLGLEGFRTICAHDGEEGLAMMRSHKPDVVLLDLMLPKLGGLEVIRGCASTIPTRPSSCLSAKDQEGDKVLALSLGADDYVTKPFSVVEVIARMRVALRRRRRTKVGGGDSGAALRRRRARRGRGGASSSRAARSSRRRASSTCSCSCTRTRARSSRASS